MTKLIEKLGLPELPKAINTLGDCWSILSAIGFSKLPITSSSIFEDSKILLARELERRAMLEALIDQCRFLESMGFISVHNESVHPIKLIESITGKTWAQIKDFLEVE